MTDERDELFAHTHPKFPANADFSVHPDAINDPRYLEKPGERQPIVAKEQTLASEVIEKTIVSEETSSSV